MKPFYTQSGVENNQELRTHESGRHGMRLETVLILGPPAPLEFRQTVCLLKVPLNIPG
jgi:hypothetical protein